MKDTPFRMVILALCAAASVVILQKAFDAGDHRRALHAVRGYKIGAQTLGAFLESEAPGGRWGTEITHSCRGVVRTTYDAPSASYQFDYVVPQHVIHPANERAREALASLAALNLPTSERGGPRSQ